MGSIQEFVDGFDGNVGYIRNRVLVGSAAFLWSKCQYLNNNSTQNGVKQFVPAPNKTDR